MKKRQLVTAALLGALWSIAYRHKRKQETEEVRTVPVDDLHASRHLRVMTYNLQAGYKAWGGRPVKPRAQLMKQVCEKLQPDLLCVQELDQHWHYYLRQLPECYRFIAPVKTGLFVYMTSLIYNSDVLTLEVWGNQAYTYGRLKRTRRMCYGVFTAKKTGRRFAVISTHLSLVFPGHERSDFMVMKHQVAELLSFVATLAHKYHCGIIIAGDFNCKEPYPHASLYDACEIYEILSRRLRDVCDMQAKGKRPSRDHIFITPGIKAYAFDYLIRPEFQMISDHYPMILDFE